MKDNKAAIKWKCLESTFKGMFLFSRVLNCQVSFTSLKVKMTRGSERQQFDSFLTASLFGVCLRAGWSSDAVYSFQVWSRESTIILSAVTSDQATPPPWFATKLPHHSLFFFLNHSRGLLRHSNPGPFWWRLRVCYLNISAFQRLWAECCQQQWNSMLGHACCGGFLFLFLEQMWAININNTSTGKREAVHQNQNTVSLWGRSKLNPNHLIIIYFISSNTSLLPGLGGTQAPQAHTCCNKDMTQCILGRWLLWQ